MALTKVTRGVIKPNENYDTHNIHSTGIVTAIGLDVNGSADISHGVNVGGGVNISGVVTAASFAGDGSALSGVAGLGTPLSNDSSSGLSKVFKNPKDLVFASGTSVIESDAASGNLAYTPNSNIVVRSGATLRVAVGTTVITNVLSIF